MSYMVEYKYLGMMGSFLDVTSISTSFLMSSSFLTTGVVLAVHLKASFVALLTAKSPYLGEASTDIPCLQLQRHWQPMLMPEEARIGVEFVVVICFAAVPSSSLLLVLQRASTIFRVLRDSSTASRRALVCML